MTSCAARPVEVSRFDVSATRVESATPLSHATWYVPSLIGGVVQVVVPSDTHWVARLCVCV